MRGWSGLRGALDFAIKCQRDEKWNALNAQFMLDKVKDGEGGHTFNFSMSPVHIGFDDDGDSITSLVVAPAVETVRARVIPPDEAALAAADDEFVWGWVNELVVNGGHPTGRGLDAKRDLVKAKRDLTQVRLRKAIDRLKDAGRLIEEKGGPSGAKWLRAVAVPTGGRHD
jgi:hypothetical protein